MQTQIILMLDANSVLAKKKVPKDPQHWWWLIGAPPSNFGPLVGSEPFLVIQLQALFCDLTPCFMGLMVFFPPTCGGYLAPIAGGFEPWFNHHFWSFKPPFWWSNHPGTAPQTACCTFSAMVDRSIGVPGHGQPWVLPDRGPCRCSLRPILG